jgi:site-specific recombinase XerD
MDPELDRYLLALPGQCRSDKTATQYRYKLRALAAWLRERDLPLCERAVADYVRDCQREQRLRPRTIRSLRPALAHFLSFTGLSLDLRAIPWPALDAPRRYIPTDADLDALELAAAQMPHRTPGKKYRRARARCILALLRYAGLRRRELLDLRLADLDTVGEPWRIYIAYGKGGTTDWVPLNDRARELVGEYLTIRMEWCKGRVLLPEIRQAWWPVDKHRRMDDKSLTNLFRDLLDAAQLTAPITPHCLRHWFCTNLSKHTSIANVSRLMRHRGIGVTLDYMHWNTDEMAGAVQALGTRPPVLPAESGREKELRERRGRPGSLAPARRPQRRPA